MYFKVRPDILNLILHLFLELSFATSPLKIRIFGLLTKIRFHAIIEDFSEASSGRRLDEATQFVRGYIKDSPKLEPLLSKINTPSLIIAGKNDKIVPPVNGQFLADRLPNNRNVLLDAEHRVWEEAAKEFNETIASWIDGNYHPLEKTS